MGDDQRASVRLGNSTRCREDVTICMRNANLHVLYEAFVATALINARPRSRSTTLWFYSESAKRHLARVARKTCAPIRGRTDCEIFTLHAKSYSTDLQCPAIKFLYSFCRANKATFQLIYLCFLEDCVYNLIN